MQKSLFDNDDSAFQAPFMQTDVLSSQYRLRSAIAQWQRNAPVVVRLTRAQAERLQQDWYYRHAQFEESVGNQVVITFGEENQASVFELLRWLGPGAELVEPKAWRAQMKAELQQMVWISDTAERGKRW